MTELLIRAVTTPLEVAGDGRTLLAKVAPYGKVAVVDDGFGPYSEQFDRGCFERPMRARAQTVRLHLEHAGQWVGRGEKWMDGPDGLAMAFRLDDTAFGRAAAFKIRDGQTPGMSVGFVPGTTVTRTGRDGAVEHRVSIKAIHHVALVPQGAYEDAQVTAVRHQSADRLALLQEWLVAQKQS